MINSVQKKTNKNKNHLILAQIWGKPGPKLTGKNALLTNLTFFDFSNPKFYLINNNFGKVSK